MKNLMMGVTLAALCATMTAFSADSIESSTVVGYATQPTVLGFVMSGSAFTSIGSEGCSVQDLTPVGENVADWCHYISLINADSSTGDTYVYLTADGAPTGKAGWYDANDGETYIEHTFDPGEGFFFNSDVEDVGLQSSGLVNLDTVQVAASVGFCAIANPRAMDLNVQDIVMTGKNVADWCHYISLMNADGSSGDTYVYLTADGAPTGKAGWYDANDGETFIEHTFEPGEGFFFVSDVDGVAVEFKAIAL